MADRTEAQQAAFVPPGVPLGIDAKAAAFAGRHGPFSLHFDAARNYVRPDDAPWSLELHGRTPEWGGFTAEEALDFADSELSGQARD